MQKLTAILLPTFLILSAGTESAESPVADDVLFVVLGKMSLYDQSATGEISLRNHHFVAEIMPREGRKILGGNLVSSSDPSMVLQFEAEGNAFLAHGARVMDPPELHQLHPDGEHVFSYETQSGSMKAQPLTLARRDTVNQMPEAATVTLSQDGSTVLPQQVDHRLALNISWERMAGNTRVADSELEDLIFVLGFDCFGNNIAHSGRPYQGGPYLTFRNREYTISADRLNPGLRYTAIVEQATSDTTIFKGVPGIATYATLTFVEFQTTGEALGETCPN